MLFVPFFSYSTGYYRIKSTNRRKVAIYSEVVVVLGGNSRNTSATKSIFKITKLKLVTISWSRTPVQNGIAVLLATITQTRGVKILQISRRHNITAGARRVT